MPACPQTTSCGLQRSISMKEALRVWQSFYCDGVFRRCERYKLALAGESVPDKLLPNGRLIDLAEAAALVAGSGGRR